MSDDDQAPVEYRPGFWEGRDEVARKMWYLVGVGAATFAISGFELLGVAINYEHTAIVSGIILVAALIWFIKL